MPGDASPSPSELALIFVVDEPIQGCAGAGPFSVRVLVDRSRNPAVYFEETGPPEFPEGFPRIVIWPFGYEADDTPTGVTIRSPDGAIEIEEGQVLNVSGQSGGDDTFRICLIQ